MRILNLYAGIGGNRKLWGEDHDITAVEINSNIAKIYKELFPSDNVIIGDAHQYLLENFNKFDFIWASPPCPSHSILRHSNPQKIIYPDMTLYQEIILLKSWFKGLFVIENVIPYYDYLIKPDVIINRHPFWCNFHISNIELEKIGVCSSDTAETKKLANKYNYDLEFLKKFSGLDKRKILRNCVIPELGLHILNQALGKLDIIESDLISKQLQIFKRKITNESNSNNR